MTIIGPDRTGLVEPVARVVADHGGNWLESRMCRLGGEFAGILRIEAAGRKTPAPAARRPANDSKPRPYRSSSAPTKAATAATKGEPSNQTRNCRTPTAGLVREITSALVRANVNVEEFSSECVSAPMSGETLFKAAARLQLPERCDLAALKTDLEKIAADLLVDVSFAKLATSHSGGHGNG